MTGWTVEQGCLCACYQLLLVAADIPLRTLTKRRHQLVRYLHVKLCRDWCVLFHCDMEATLFCAFLVSESSSKWPRACVVLLNNVRDEDIVPSISSVSLTLLKCSSCQLQCIVSEAEIQTWRQGTVVQTFGFFCIQCSAVLGLQYRHKSWRYCGLLLWVS